jgi:hypothetical protein
MKRYKSALKYFVHLIKLGDLLDRRRVFHWQYGGKARTNELIIIKYDSEAEYVEFEETIDFVFMKRVVDFGQSVRSEIPIELKRAKTIIYDRLTSGPLVEQNAFYGQVMRDVEELVRIVSEDTVYAKYPYIAEALSSIQDFVAVHRPLPAGQIRAVEAAVTERVMEQVTGFHYRYYEEGSRDEDKALTRKFLGDLFVGLRDNLKLIAPDTTLEDFRAIFSGKVVTKRVRWMGVNNQLYCFIQAISPKLCAPWQRKLEKKWATTAVCFVNREGEVFTEKQLQNPGISTEKVCNVREIEELAKILR